MQLELQQKTIGHLPPPVVIRRKQILVNQSHRPDKCGRGFANIFRDEELESSESHDSSIRSRHRPTETISTPSINREICSETSDRPKWRPLVKSWSSNGTPKVYVESDTTWSSYSYDRDHSIHDKHQEKLKNYQDSSKQLFIDRLSSLSSYCLQDSEFASEERDILIESTRSTTSLRRSKFSRFGSRKTNGSFASLKDQSGSFQQLDVVERSTWRNGFSPKVSFESDTVSEIQEEEDDYFDDRPSTSTAITFRKRLACWSKEGKDLLVKSVNSSNTLAPTTMPCIKSPRAMSEHLLGQLEVPVTPVVMGALKVKGGSFRDGDNKNDKDDAPRQKWSSVRIKGGSTKSLLLENGGIQTAAMKGQITKEVYFIKPFFQIFSFSIFFPFHVPFFLFPHVPFAIFFTFPRSLLQHFSLLPCPFFDTLKFYGKKKFFPQKKLIKILIEMKF